MRSRLLALGVLLIAATAQGGQHTCRWTFPGGTPATADTCTPPPVTFAAPGAKRVTLTVCSGACTSTSKTLQVLDPRPRVVKVTPPAGPIYPGDQVVVSAVVSGAPPLAVTWRLPGGSTSSANPLTVTVPTNTRRLPLSLVVSNPTGTVTYPLSLPVLDPKPRASIRLSPTPLYVGQTLNASATVTGRPPFQFRWRLEPENLKSETSNLAWPTSGAAPGSRRLSLTVTNAAGAYSVTTTVKLSPPPLVFSFKPVCPNLCFFPVNSSVSFAVEASEGVERFEYDWNGDGRFDVTSPRPVPSYVYMQPGSYRPRLRVTSGERSQTVSSLSLVHVTRP